MPPAPRVRPSADVEQHLRNLSTLRRQGLIPEAEFKRRRQQILDDSF
jgi:hypothetical protein